MMKGYPLFSADRVFKLYLTGSFFYNTIIVTNINITERKK